jgi:arylsulfatase A-like enzyme
MVAKAKYIKMYRDLPRLRRIHAAMVTMMDDSIGQIMGRLGERGLVDNTFVFFSSDNGAANWSLRGEGGGSNAPYREYKRSLFDGGGRMPAIVSWPGTVPAGQRRDQLVIGMDVFSTIVELVGAEAPGHRVIDGMSWMGLLKDASQPGHEVLFFEWDNQHAVRSGPWKLVANGLLDMHLSRQNRPDPKSEDYLFLANTEEDPGESVNQRGQHPEVVGKLLKMHADWRRSVMTDPTTSSSSFDAGAGKKAE